MWTSFRKKCTCEKKISVLIALPIILGDGRILIEVEVSKTFRKDNIRFEKTCVPSLWDEFFWRSNLGRNVFKKKNFWEVLGWCSLYNCVCTKTVLSWLGMEINVSGDTIQGKTRIHYISLEKEGKGSVKIRRGKLMGSRIFVSVLYCEKNRDLPEEMVFLVFHFFFSWNYIFREKYWVCTVGLALFFVLKNTKVTRWE